MVLVVLAFVVLTAAAMLDAYGPCVGRRDAGKAAGCFIGLFAFFALVCLTKLFCVASNHPRRFHAPH